MVFYTVQEFRQEFLRLSQFMHLTDRRMDGQTDEHTFLSCIRPPYIDACAVKNDRILNNIYESKTINFKSRNYSDF